jgi:two-component system response regulator
MNTKVILLVEDNPDDEALALRALKKTNTPHEVVVVHDGAEAMDFLLASGAYSGRDTRIAPDLVLLDLKLPKVSGLELLRQLRDYEPTRYLPVVVLTTSNEARDIAQSYELGANSYIRKPVGFSEFSFAVEKLGLYWLELNVAPSSVLSP